MRPHAAHAQKSLAIEQKPRKVYPFSVIPGGAYSADELALARRVDRVVAAHYADFDPSTVAVRTLPEDEFLYVSYRKADRVYWTTDKRRIPKGNCVLTDGKHLARARCGNRLSATPQFPVLYGPQPAEASLNAPEVPGPFDLPKAPLFAAAYDGPELPLLGSPRPFGFPREMSGASPYLAFGPPFSVFPPMILATGPTLGISPRTPASSGTGPVGGGGGPVGAGGGGGPSGGGGGPVLGSVPEPVPAALLVLGLSGLFLIRVRLTRRFFRPDSATND